MFIVINSEYLQYCCQLKSLTLNIQGMLSLLPGLFRNMETARARASSMLVTSPICKPSCRHHTTASAHVALPEYNLNSWSPILVAATIRILLSEAWSLSK